MEPSERRDAVLCHGIAVGTVIALRLLTRAHICDDAYITIKTALNFARGDGLAFNSGDRLYVSTSPLWAILIGCLALTGLDTISAVQVLGVLAEIAAACAIVRLGHAAAGSRRVGLVAAVLLITNPAFALTSGSGMELPLYLALIAASGALLVQNRQAWALALAALSVWVRFDGVLLLAVTAGFVLAAPPRLDPRKPLSAVPALAIVVAYGAFGWLYFGDLVPVSVQRKVGTVALLSPGWLHGAALVAANFGLAFVGTGLSFYKQVSLLLVMPIAAVEGARRAWRARRTGLVPVVVFAALYAGSFVASGRAYAVNFPWYFMPPLIAGYQLAAIGVESLLTRWTPRRMPAAMVGFALAWSLASVVPLELGAARFEQRSVNERERTYAAETLWLDRHLPTGAYVAANEIGTVGFFARRDVRVLDLFGLLRSEADRSRTEAELMAEYHPEAVITQAKFGYRAMIDKAAPDAYVWLPFRKGLVGLRRDLAPTLLAFQGELAKIYGDVDLAHEPRWTIKFQ
jgi:hypothetical protein